MTVYLVFRKLGTSMIFQNAKFRAKEYLNVPDLKTIREKTGMTVFELAVESGVSTSTINRMEGGKQAVSRRIAYKVLNVLSQKLGRDLTVEEVEELKVQ